MYYYRAWSEPQAPPPQPPPPPPAQTAGGSISLSHPPPPQNQHYPVPLQHTQQPLPHSPYPTNPSLTHPPCQPSPIQWNPGENNPYAPHGGYAPAVYPCAGEGTSAAAVAVVVDGVGRYGGEESREISATEAIRNDGTYSVGYIAPPPNCFLAESGLPQQNSFNPPIQSTLPYQNTYIQPIQSVLPYQNALNPPIQSTLPHQNALDPPLLKNTKRNVRQKVAKVPQTSHCVVCKLDCNSQDALKSHKRGKKHQKNLQKLQDSITLKPAGSVASAGEEKSKEVKRKSASLAETEDELKTKKIRVLEAGASAGEVRVCSICNVVVNSQKVYECHLAGQKHLAVVEKLKKAVVS